MKDEPEISNDSSKPEDEVIEFSACGMSNIEQASDYIPISNTNLRYENYSDESSKTVIRQSEDSSNTAKS